MRWYRKLVSRGSSVVVVVVVVVVVFVVVVNIVIYFYTRKRCVLDKNYQKLHGMLPFFKDGWS
jgi:predicted PurR-regulated permease PerM